MGTEYCITGKLSCLDLRADMLDNMSAMVTGPLSYRAPRIFDRHPLAYGA